MKILLTNEEWCWAYIGFDIGAKRILIPLIHKQPLANAFQNKRSWKSHNIRRKTHLLESFFNKVVTLKCLFSCEYCEIFKNRFFIEHLRWLLLLIQVFFYAGNQLIINKCRKASVSMKPTLTRWGGLSN